MKIFWLIAVLVLLVGISVPAEQADAKTVVRTGEYVSLGEEQEVAGNFYALGNTVSVSGSIAGDLHAIAGSITLNGSVRDDVFFVGGTVALHASTSEDVRIIAGDVTLAEAVGGSVAIMAGRVKILSTATIAGDVLIYGGDVTIEGKIEGQVLGNIKQLRIDGPVAGGMDVVVGSLTLGERADVTGDVRYQSPIEVIRAPGAVITGDLVPVAPSVLATPISAAKIFAVFFLMLLFTTLTLFLLGRPLMEKFIKSVSLRPLHYGLVGGAGLVFLPLMASVLMASVLGGFLGIIVIGAGIVGLVLALPLSALLIGSLIFQVVYKRPQVDILSLFAGSIGLCALLLIPIVGPVLVLLAVFCTFGGLLLHLYNIFRFARS